MVSQERNQPIHQVLQEPKVDGVKNIWHQSTCRIEASKGPEDSFCGSSSAFIEVLKSFVLSPLAIRWMSRFDQFPKVPWVVSKRCGRRYCAPKRRFRCFANMAEPRFDGMEIDILDIVCCPRTNNREAFPDSPIRAKHVFPTLK